MGSILFITNLNVQEVGKHKCIHATPKYLFALVLSPSVHFKASPAKEQPKLATHCVNPDQFSIKFEAYGCGTRLCEWMSASGCSQSIWVYVRDERENVSCEAI